MDVEPPLETDAKFAETRKPGMRAFNDPSMTSEALFALDAFAGDSRGDTASS